MSEPIQPSPRMSQNRRPGMGDTFALLLASHEVADHWVQTHRQATTKGRPGREGRAACARHVTGLIAAHGAALAAGALATGERLRPGRTVAGLAVIAATHYWADRRTTLAALADRTGKTEFYQLGDPKAAPTGTGAYALDQAWHVGWLAVAALIITGRPGH